MKVKKRSADIGIQYFYHYNLTTIGMYNGYHRFIVLNQKGESIADIGVQYFYHFNLTTIGMNNGLSQVYCILPEGRIHLYTKGKYFSDSDFLSLHVIKPRVVATIHAFINECVPKTEDILPEQWDLCIDTGHFDCNSIFKCKSYIEFEHCHRKSRLRGYKVYAQLNCVCMKFIMRIQVKMHFNI